MKFEEKYRTKLPVNSRSEGAERLTGLFLAGKGFSFLRLCDRELDFLVNWQAGGDFSYKKDSQTFPMSCNVAMGSLGISLDHAPRLQEAYEGCSLLDCNSHNPKVVQLREKWKHEPDPAQSSILDEPVCGVVEDWVPQELPKALRRVKVVICSAESAILRELTKDPDYFKAIGDDWSCLENGIFIQPINDGRTLSEDLDAVKDQIIKACTELGTSFACLSLGGAAKIIAYELARDHAINCIDAGSMIRGLTYAGSCGNSTTRSMHNPIFFRIPFDTHMSAVERAYPDASPEFILAKAHAQLCLDRQRFVPGKILVPEIYDPDSIDRSNEGIARFLSALEVYKSRYGRLFKHSWNTKTQRKEFTSWLLQQDDGFRGKMYRFVKSLNWK